MISLHCQWNNNNIRWSWSLACCVQWRFVAEFWFQWQWWPCDRQWDGPAKISWLEMKSGHLWLWWQMASFYHGSHVSRTDFFQKFPGPGSPGIYLWFSLINMRFMYRKPCVNKCTKYCCYVLTKWFLCNLWWTFCDGLYCRTVYTIIIHNNVRLIWSRQTAQPYMRYIQQTTVCHAGSKDTHIHCHAGQQQPGLAYRAVCQKQTVPSGPLARKHSPVGASKARWNSSDE